MICQQIMPAVSQLYRVVTAIIMGNSTMKVTVATGGLLPSIAGEALGLAAWIANIKISASTAAAVKPTALVCGLSGIDNLGLWH